MRIGHGYDVHRLVEGRKLILGGVEIPYEKVPMAAPLKQAFDENVDRIRRERLPGELASALKQQLRIAIKR